MSRKARRAHARPAEPPAPLIAPQDATANRSRLRVLAITTLITAAVTTAVTVAFSGLGPLWHVVFPKPPVTTHLERYQPPPPAAPSPSPSITVRAGGVHAKVGYLDLWDHHAWALPGLVAPADVPRIDDPDLLDPWTVLSDWATRAGGADIGSTRIRVTVTGQDKDVVIDGLCAHIVGGRTAPMKGTLVHVQPDGSEPEPATVDLDARRPCSPELSTAPVHVEARKNTVIDLSALTRRHTVTWYPELLLVVDGERVTVPLRETEPFRTTALLADLADYRRYVVYARSAEAFMESLPDPIDVVNINDYAYGRRG